MSNHQSRPPPPEEPLDGEAPVEEEQLLPQDIRPGMLNIIRRLQSVAKTKGCAIVTIRILFDPDGKPICWTSPVVVKLEPAALCGDRGILFDLLAKGPC